MYPRVTATSGVKVNLPKAHLFKEENKKTFMQRLMVPEPVIVSRLAPVLTPHSKPVWLHSNNLTGNLKHEKWV